MGLPSSTSPPPTPLSLCVSVDCRLECMIGESCVGVGSWAEGGWRMVGCERWKEERSSRLSQVALFRLLVPTSLHQPHLYRIASHLVKLLLSVFCSSGHLLATRLAFRSPDTPARRSPSSLLRPSTETTIQSPSTVEIHT